MPTGTTGWLVMLLSFVLTFVVARTLGKHFRSERRRKAQAQSHALESRQVRRARERRGRP